MMSRVQKGLVAGFAATAVVSIIEAINMTVGHWAVAFPQLLAVILQNPDTPESKGILFAVGAFILMGLIVAPIGGAGMFFMRAGFGTLAWMVASHAIFGIVLGTVYGRLVERERRLRVPVGSAPAH